MEDTTDFDIEEMEPALDRITTLIDDLSALRLAFESSLTTMTTKTRDVDMTQALQHVSDLEQLYETFGEPARPKDVMKSGPAEEEISVLDEKLEEVIPEEAFRESKRQKLLTEGEGEVISSFLGLPKMVHPASAARDRRSSPDIEDQIKTSDLRKDLEEITADPDPSQDSRLVVHDTEIEEHEDQPHASDTMSQLEDLIRASPAVRQTYERALAMPTPSDHDACMELVARMGVPIIKAGIPYEAEGLAASLARAGLVDFVGTEDSDVVAYEVSPLNCHTDS